MKTTNRAAKRYCRSIRSWLPCSRKMKQPIMEQISSSVHGYLEEHPDATLVDLQTQFGMPQKIAASYVDTMNTADILKNLRIRRRIMMIVLAAVLALLVSWVTVVTWAIYNERNATAAPYIEVTIE